MGGCWRCNKGVPNVTFCGTKNMTQKNAVVVVRDGGALVTFLQRQESDSKTQLACLQNQAWQVPNTTPKRAGKINLRGPNRVALDDPAPKVTHMAVDCLSLHCGMRQGLKIAVTRQCGMWQGLRTYSSLDGFASSIFPATHSPLPSAGVGGFQDSAAPLCTCKQLAQH